MTFLDDFPENDLLAAMGDDMTYVAKSGEPIKGKAHVEFGVERAGNEAFIIERVNMVEFAKSLIPDPRRGDLLTIRGITYSVDGIDSDDGIFVRVLIR